MAHVKEVTLPRLIGSRETVRALLLHEAPLVDAVVLLNARELRSASASAADEFVIVALVEGSAAALEIVGATPEFAKDVETSARDYGVADKIKELSAH